MKKPLINPSIILTVGLLVAIALIILQGNYHGPRKISNLENIHGIPFTQQPDVISVTEKLAHADVDIAGPVFAQQLTLTITFTPLDIQSLHVGVRANSFWLSYPKTLLFEQKLLADIPILGMDKVTTTVSIPLTDKIQDDDGSIDLMFFSQHRDSSSAEYEGDKDKSHWLLHSLEASVQPYQPSQSEIKDFIKSWIKREQLV